MSGSIGIPPGTAWLQNARQGRHKSPRYFEGSGNDIQEVAHTEPRVGSWQWRLSLGATQGLNDWILEASPPNDEDWIIWHQGDLGSIMGALRGVEGQAGAIEPGR